MNSPQADKNENTATEQRELEGRLVALLRDLVAIESTDPGTYEGDIAQFIFSWLEARTPLAGTCAEQIVLEQLEVLPGRPCVRIYIPSRVEGTNAQSAAASPAKLNLLAHMDTVREGSGWDPLTPAFEPVLQNGKLYGRGACDMKAGLAVALIGIEDVLREVGSLGLLPAESLALVCTCDEEDIMRGVEACIARGWLGCDGWTMDLEPTSGSARGSHKGRTWFEVTVSGITAHASTPWAGADAIAGAAELIARIRAAVLALPEHAELGTSTVTFGQISGGYSPYVVPDSCSFTVDLRLVPPASTSAVRATIDKAIAEVEALIPGVSVSLTCTGDRPPIELSTNSELLAALGRAHTEALGTPLKREVFTGYTDTAVVAGLCHNPECLSFGPGNLELAHKPNEYVAVADLVRVSQVLSALIGREIL